MMVLLTFHVLRFDLFSIRYFAHFPTRRKVNKRNDCAKQRADTYWAVPPSSTGPSTLTTEKPDELKILYTGKPEKVEALQANHQRGFEFRTGATDAERAQIEAEWMRPPESHILSLHEQFPACKNQPK